MLLELPREERPRERMARLGPAALSDRELLAALIDADADTAARLARQHVTDFDQAIRAVV